MYKRQGFENLSISYSDYDIYQNKLDEVELVAIDGRLDSIREIKTDDEIEKLRVAESIGDAAFKYILGFLKEGITEKEVALELEYYMKKNGAEGLSFDTIAASGRNSSMPHAIPSDKKLEAGDFLTMDFGCIYDGYCSDMTRTLLFGNVSEEHMRIFNLVQESQDKAIAAIRPGVMAKDVEDAHRAVFLRENLDDYALRGLGHGIGLQIHECPRIVIGNETVLKPGMIFTVEPGLYFPNDCGVRTEDDVLVTENGVENLSHTPHEIHIG